MKLKKGDNVLVISGKDRGKKGKISQVFGEKNRVSVEGVNKMIRHIKPRREGEKGQRVEFYAPINASNVMIICTKCNKPTRLGSRKVEGKKKKQRVCKKCKEAI